MARIDSSRMTSILLSEDLKSIYFQSILDNRAVHTKLSLNQIVPPRTIYVNPRYRGATAKRHMYPVIVFNFAQSFVDQGKVDSIMKDYTSKFDEMEKPDPNYYLKYKKDFLEKHGNKALGLDILFLFCKSHNLLDLYHEPEK